MKVIGFAGYSGSGKTTLVEQIIPLLCRQGLKVSVIKHAHHRFDIDHPGKDSWRHRKAGASEVVIASDMRLALVREFAQPTQITVHQMIAELDPSVDWVLVEGFKESGISKVEVWREPAADDQARPVRYPEDDAIVAIATDDAARLPVATALPVLDLNQPAQVAQWLLAQGGRFAYAPGPRSAP